MDTNIKAWFKLLYSLDTLIVPPVVIKHSAVWVSFFALQSKKIQNKEPCLQQAETL
jgi:hypothetical protein